MNVPISSILAKIPGLPADYADHVHLGEVVAGAMLADVDSFSEHPAPRVYAVSIKRADKQSELVVNCKCPARALCTHVVAFYAVAKADDPAVIAAKTSGETESELLSENNTHRRGLMLIAQAQEKFADAMQDFADGVALYVREGVES